MLKAEREYFSIKKRKHKKWRGARTPISGACIGTPKSNNNNNNVVQGSRGLGEHSVEVVVVVLLVGTTFSPGSVVAVVDKMTYSTMQHSQFSCVTFQSHISPLSILFQSLRLGQFL